MAFSFTQEQYRAITLKKKNILVSAAAGSGKTAVLTERVVHQILEGTPIERLVVLTFTNAAAKEMLTRIRKKLNVSDSVYAKKAIEMLPLAHIQTFDSFALFILKKYGYLLNISASISVMDSLTLSMTKQAIIEQLFESYYADNNPDFHAYIDTYTTRNDRMLKQQIIDFNDALSLYYDRNDIIAHIQNMFNENTFETFFNQYFSMIKDHQVQLKNTLSKIEDYCIHSVVATYHECLNVYYKDILQADDYQALHRAFNALGRMPSIGPVNKAFKDSDDTNILKALNTYKERLSKTIDAMKTLCEEDYDTHEKGFYKTEAHIPIMIKLIQAFEYQLDQHQQHLEQFDFNRIAHKALLLIEQEPRVKSDLQSIIDEIMIDEYQDTSILQERCIRAIAPKRVFMVGDIKQSIYRFRHADPKLFMDKYLSYRHQDDAEVIDLNLNFRSRKPVLESINTAFKALMDSAVGGVEYDHHQQLSYGNHAYDKATDDQTPYGLQLYTYDADKHQALFKEIKPKTFEIMWIASHIKAQMQHVKTYENNQLRKAQWGDFVIICDRSSAFDAFVQYFEAYNIPLMVHKEASMIDLAVFDVIRNILKLLRALESKSHYKTDFKHAFYAVTRSFLCRYDDDLLIRQILNFPKTLTHTQALKASILPPLASFFDIVFNLLKRQKTEPLFDVLNHIIQHFDFYDAITYLEHTEIAQERLMFVLNLAREKSEKGITIDAFLETLEYAKHHPKQDIDYLPLKQLDHHRVHLMTIHKAKGLEFPHLYIAHLENTFAVQTMKPYDFDAQYGLIVAHDDSGLNQSFIHDLKVNDEKKLDISERLRVFYVAMTRAKESIHMCLPVSSKDNEFFDLSIHERQSMRSFKTFMQSVFNDDKLQFIDVEDIINHAPSLQFDTESISQVQYSKQYRKQTFEMQSVEPFSYSQATQELLDRSTLSVINQGLNLHEALEMVDFKQKSPIVSLDDTVANKVLQGLLNQPLMRQLDIKEVYKEFPFSFIENDQRINGFIDLLIETDEAFYVIDYKLKNIKKEAYVAQIQGYVKVIQNMTNKPVSGYLYSLLDQTFESVKKA